MKNNCPTIGVLGVPIDRTYPAANVALRHTIEQKGCVISEYAPGESTPGPVDFCSATGSSRRSARAAGGGSPRKKRHHVHRVPRGAVRQTGVRGAGQHLLAQFGRDKRPAAGRPRPARSAAEPTCWALGLQSAGGAGKAAAEPLSENERRVLSCIGPQPLGSGGAVRAQRPAHGGAAGHPDEAGAHRPGAVPAGQAVCAAIV